MAGQSLDRPLDRPEAQKCRHQPTSPSCPAHAAGLSRKTRGHGALTGSQPTPKAHCAGAATNEEPHHHRAPSRPPACIACQLRHDLSARILASNRRYSQPLGNCGAGRCSFQFELARERGFSSAWGRPDACRWPDSEIRGRAKLSRRLCALHRPARSEIAGKKGKAAMWHILAHEQLGICGSSR